MKVGSGVRRTRDCAAMSTLMDSDQWCLLVARRPKSVFCAVREGLRDGTGLDVRVLIV